MATKYKKTVDPPTSIWVVCDSATGHPLFVSREPELVEDLMDGEMIYNYTLKTPKPRRANG